MIHDSSAISLSSWPGPQPAYPAKTRARVRGCRHRRRSRSRREEADRAEHESCRLGRVTEVPEHDDRLGLHRASDVDEIVIVDELARAAEPRPRPRPARGDSGSRPSPPRRRALRRAGRCGGSSGRADRGRRRGAVRGASPQAHCDGRGPLGSGDGAEPRDPSDPHVLAGCRRKVTSPSSRSDVPEPAAGRGADQERVRLRRSVHARPDERREVVRAVVRARRADDGRCGRAGRRVT